MYDIDWMEKVMISYDHKIVKNIESVLARLSHAAGVNHLNWLVYLLNAKRQ